MFYPTSVGLERGVPAAIYHPKRFQREMRDWRRWRCTTLAWHAVTEVGGRLYRPRRSGHDRRRYEAALETFLLGATTLPHGEPDDGLHDLAWDDFDGYHEAMLGHDLLPEDESAGEPGRCAERR